MSTKEMYQVGKTLSDNKKAHEEDVMKRYRAIVSYYNTALDEDNADIKHIQKVSSMMMKTFTDPDDLDLVNRQWQKDLVGKEAQLFAKMVAASGMPTQKGLEDAIRTWPVDQAQKDQMMGRLKAMKAQREFSLGEKE